MINSDGRYLYSEICTNKTSFLFTSLLFILLFIIIVYKVRKKCIDSSNLRNQRGSGVSEENYSPSRLMTNTTYKNSQYKRKGIENVFTLQLFSLMFAFKLHDHFPGNTLCHESNFLYFSTIIVFFTSHASDDSSQDYRNKVISHFHGANIRAFNECFGNTESSIFAAGKNPTRCIDTESLFDDLKSGKKGEKDFNIFLKQRPSFQHLQEGVLLCSSINIYNTHHHLHNHPHKLICSHNYW